MHKLLFAGLAFCAGFGCETLSAVQLPYLSAPSDPLATAVTKNVYTYLATRRGQTQNRMIEGQHLGDYDDLTGAHPEWFDPSTYAIDGQIPGLFGTGYYGVGQYPDNTHITVTNAELIQIWNDDHPIMHIVAVPSNPWNPLVGRDWFAGQGTLAELFRGANPTTPQWINFWDGIDKIAAGLQELQDEGIPVIFRPFPEFNTGHTAGAQKGGKWYRIDQSGANFVQLWRDVYTYYTTPVAQGGKGLHNLLFCWEVWALRSEHNQSDTIPGGLSAWYPEVIGGVDAGKYVDLVGGAYFFDPPESDYYEGSSADFTFAETSHPDQDQTLYDFLVRQDRPFCASQYGVQQDGNEDGEHQLTLDFMDYVDGDGDTNPMAFASYWSGNRAVHLQLQASEFVADSGVATNDDLPSFNTAVFKSTATYDGYVLQSSGTAVSNLSGQGALRVGDDTANKQYKAFVSFNTSSLADNAVVTAATVRLKRGSVSGGQNPFSAGFGTLKVDVKGGGTGLADSGFGGAPALVYADWSAGAGAADVVSGGMSNPVANGDWSTGNLNAAGLNIVNETGHTQFRLYFSTATAVPGVANYLGFFSGEAAAADQPELVITYK